MPGFLRHAGAALIAVGIVLVVVAARSAIFAPNAACVGRSRELIAALQQYVQDYDEHFPAQMTTQAGFQAALLPYTSGPAAFICPATSKPYTPNSALAGQSMAAFNRDTTVAFQDPKAHADGLKTVTYLDGTVMRGNVVQGDPTLLSMQYASDLVRATLQYAQDNDEHLPPTDTQAHFQAAVGPYVLSSRDFYSPATGQPFAPNPNISEMSLAAFPEPNQIVGVQSSVPEPDSFSTIGYLDGHVVHGGQSLPAPSAMANIRTILMASLQYEQDNNEYLPPTTSYSAFESALSPYVHDPSVFTDPVSGQPFMLNKSVSGEYLARIANPAGTILIKAPILDQNGNLDIGYVSGGVQAMSYHIVRTMAVGADNDTRLVWYCAFGRHNAYDLGAETMWIVDASGDVISKVTLGHGLNPISTAVEPDDTMRMLSINIFSTSPADLSPVGSLTTLRSGGTVNTKSYPSFDGWMPTAIGAGANDQPVALWNYYDGTAAVWLMHPAGGYNDSVDLSPPSGGSAIDLAVGGDNNIHVLWANSNGGATIQTLNAAGVLQGSISLGPVSGYSPAGLIVDPSGNRRVLWNGAEGSASVWTIDSSGNVLDKQDFAGTSGWHAAKIGVGDDGNLRILWTDSDDNARLDIVQPDGTLVNSTTFQPFYTG